MIPQVSGKIGKFMCTSIFLTLTLKEPVILRSQLRHESSKVYNNIGV